MRRIPPSRPYYHPFPPSGPFVGFSLGPGSRAVAALLLTALLWCLAGRTASASSFPQSVASGDPAPDSVVLWTRLAPIAGEQGDAPVSLEVATDPGFSASVIQRRELLARAEHDHCVKVRVSGLDPRTTYYYRFLHNGEVSPTGRTKTAPSPNDPVPVRFAVLNCMDYVGRYYNTLAHLALTEADSTDFVAHLGDYIYETTGDPSFQATSGPRQIKFDDEAGAVRLGGAASPFYAAASLDNYRQLYRTYRADPALQRVHELFPFVNIWDDHEFADDCWGAHTTTSDGRSVELNADRRRNAERAFFEYLPIGIGMDDQGVRIDDSILYPNARIYRNFRFGSLFQLFLTDYRSFRPDHLVPEDAFPGKITMTQADCAALLGDAWGKVRGSFDAYVNIDSPEYAGLKPVILAIATGAYMAEGAGAADAQARAVLAVSGNLSTTYINGLMAAAGRQPAFQPQDLAAMPRGLSFLLIGKQSLFSKYGSRYLVARDTFRLYAAFRGLTDPETQDAYGPTQTTDLAQSLATSPVTWKVVADSVSFTPLGFDFAHPPLPLPAGFPDALRVNLQLNADDWDGFPDGRRAMLDLLASANAVVISGDIHSSFVTRHLSSSGKTVPEFTISSVSSETFRDEVRAAALGNPLTAGLPGLDALVGATDLLASEAMKAGGQGQIVDSRTDANGYMVIQVTRDGLVADYRHIPANQVTNDWTSNPGALRSLFDSKSYGVSSTTNGLSVAPMEVRLKVGDRLYSGFRNDLTNGAWVYIDADPAAGSPLRATQRSLGYREVDYKAAVYPVLTFTPAVATTNGNVVTYDYSSQAAKTATVGFWAAKDLPVIVGPDGNAYITDGHHTTAGYLMPASPVRRIIPGADRIVLGHVVANYFDPRNPHVPDDAWWVARAAENNSFLYGPEGDVLALPDEPGYAARQPILPSALAMPTTPSTLTTNGARAMTPSQYRGLAWGLADGILDVAKDKAGKKIAGYKKSPPWGGADINFVEFYWADYLRNRVVWDDAKPGSPLGSSSVDGNLIEAPFAFYTAVANGVALARSEAYRDQHGRRLTEYTNASAFAPNTVYWAGASLSNGLAVATDTYNLYLTDDSTIVGDVTPSQLSTNILHIHSAGSLQVSNRIQNVRTLLVNDTLEINTLWKDAVTNSAMKLPPGLGSVTLTGAATVSSSTIVSNGEFLVKGALTSPRVLVPAGVLGGDGTIVGDVIVGPGGTLAPGEGIGTLSIAGSLALQGAVSVELTKSAGGTAQDSITGLTTLTYGGTLAVAVTGAPLALGDAFHIFDARHFDGTFQQCELPQLPAGLAWDTTRLLTEGTLVVGAFGATPPSLGSLPSVLTMDEGVTGFLPGGAFGSEPILYQWSFNDAPLGPPTSWGNLPLGVVHEAQQGVYRLVAGNAAGTANSAAIMLVVNQAPTARSAAITVPWTDGIAVDLEADDADGDTVTYRITASPTLGTLEGAPPHLVYHPNLGANGSEKIVFKANDGRLDSAPATLTIQIDGWANKGLVGVGRIPAASFDARGPGIDTLGGIGSGMCLDKTTWTRDCNDVSGFTYSGTLYALPDRGFGDGTQNFAPRVETVELSIAPYYGAGPVAQEQISLRNTATLLLNDHGVLFTGFDANAAAQTNYPASTADSLGAGRRSLDPEGIARLGDGTFFISDEYGPFVYKFDATGSLLMTLTPPASLLPKIGSYPGTNRFTAVDVPVSGRRNNRGLEGLSATPDGKRLIAMLQSPTMQDSGAGNSGRNTRLLVFDIDPASPSYGSTVAEYVYQLTLNGSSQTNKNTPVSEVLALNRENFLILERDSGLGLGTGVGPSTYKRIVLASIAGASNILNTPYDLEKGAPGQVSLPASGLPADIKPVQRFDLVDLIDPAQLAKFGLNNSTNQDGNTLSEKWEGLAIAPLNDPAAPHDHLLLAMNDNDFKAPVVYHNGVAVGTNDVPVDTMMLAFRVSLPTYNEPAPANRAPQIALQGPTNAVLSTPAAFTLKARAYDQDGSIARVEFWSNGTKLAEDSAYPFELPVLVDSPGIVRVTAVAYDNEGLVSTPGEYTVEAITANAPPAVALAYPTNGAAFKAPANFTLTAVAGDQDGWISKLEFFRAGTSIGTVTTGAMGLTVANQPLGDAVYTVVATDNHGNSSTSAPVAVRIERNRSTAPLTFQLLHASDLEAGVQASVDAPNFSSVLAGLKALYPTNTLVLSSGDNYIPGPFFNAAGDPAAGFNGVAGRADIAMLNAMGFQAAAFGNHEFDSGTPQVRSLILRDGAIYAGTAFPYLSANLTFGTDGSMASLVTADGQNGAALSNKVAKACVLFVAGQPIGIVGATTPDLRAISSPGTVSVVTNVAAAVQQAVDALLATGVNKVVLLAHLQQFANEIDLAGQLRDVDVIVAGGSHAIFAKPADRLRDGDEASASYPVWARSLTGEPVAVVNCGPNYRYAGRLVASFDAAGIIASVDPVSGSYATDPEGVAATGSIPPNPTVLTIATNIGNIIASKDGNLFGSTTVYLNGLRTSVRIEESNLGDLTADANLSFGRQRDPRASLSLKNGGGIRDSIGAVLGYGGGAEYVPPLPNPAVGKGYGQISQLDIENALRFNNGLALITLTAQQLRDAMEWGVAAVAPGATPGQFPQVSGLWFAYNPANPPMTYLKAVDGTIRGIATPGSRLQTLVAAREAGASTSLWIEGFSKETRHGPSAWSPSTSWRRVATITTLSPRPPTGWTSRLRERPRRSAQTARNNGPWRLT